MYIFVYYKTNQKRKDFVGHSFRSWKNTCIDIVNIIRKGGGGNVTEAKPKMWLFDHGCVI